jgi:hypothetical protein
MTRGWCVRVSVFDDLVVSISERELCGRDLSEADKDLIRDCARHLLSFVGEAGAAALRPIEPPDFDQIADAIATRVESHCSSLDPERETDDDAVRATVIRAIAEQLRQLWNQTK